MSRSTVFVGNIAYDVKEADLRTVFERVGKVNSFRFVLDKETGRPRGFGFCEYETEAQAQLAIDTLNNYEIGGRNLKVDSADGNQDGTGAGPRGGRQQKDIDKALEQLGLEEIYNVIEKFKQFIQDDYQASKRLLQQSPVLALALLKCQQLLSLLHPSPEQQTTQQPQLNQPLGAPSGMQQQPVWGQPAPNLPPVQQTMAQQQFAAQPLPPSIPLQTAPQKPPQPLPADPAFAQQASSLESQNQQLIKEIMQLTPQQIESLPPQERANVLQIIQQLNLAPQMQM